jgi:hypothetical protein
MTDDLLIVDDSGNYKKKRPVMPQWMFGRS